MEDSTKNFLLQSQKRKKFWPDKDEKFKASAEWKEVVGQEQFAPGMSQLTSLAIIDPGFHHIPYLETWDH